MLTQRKFEAVINKPILNIDTVEKNIIDSDLNSDEDQNLQQKYIMYTKLKQNYANVVFNLETTSNKEIEVKNKI